MGLDQAKRKELRSRILKVTKSKGMVCDETYPDEVLDALEPILDTRGCQVAANEDGFLAVYFPPHSYEECGKPAAFMCEAENHIWYVCADPEHAKAASEHLETINIGGGLLVPLDGSLRKN